jgi:hypothetical protein
MTLNNLEVGIRLNDFLIDKFINKEQALIVKYTFINILVKGRLQT